jgi:eukaryotic-like serine/threonine-protein kinase
VNRETVPGLDDTVAAALAKDEDVRDESRLAPGTVVDRYEIVEVRGAGAMGVVYRGRDRRLGRDVAIKLLKSGTPGSDHCGRLCALLVREAQTLARISHPNVIGIHDVGDFAGCVYVAMEYIDGDTLTTWSARSGRTCQERLDVLLAAGAGLAAAHGGHIIHRDFKPDNVLVGAAGDVKVTDFGVARAPIDVEAPADIGCGCAASSDASCAIDPNAIVGTPMYMAPEVMAGTPADTRSDQFSFAASAWEVLYGARPFTGEDIIQLFTLRSNDAISAPPSTPAAQLVPSRLAAVLGRALRASPSRRYPSMNGLLKELRVDDASVSG